MKTLIIFTILILCSFNVYSQNITNTLGTSGLFTIRDASNNYLSLNQTTGQVNILKSLRLENTTGSAIGVIFSGPNRFIHNYGTANTFLGILSGNFTMTGYQNTALGFFSLTSNTTGYQNTALGFQSLALNTAGNNNTAVGNSSLVNNTTGYNNTALGYLSLSSNTIGYYNTALGSQSLFSNTNGYNNTALGFYSLYSNTGGYENTSMGYQSLYTNSGGYYNTALGSQSLSFNTTGSGNTAVGLQSLYSNTTGGTNTAVGLLSLYSNTTAYENTAVGFQSLTHNTTGYENTAVGVSSLLNNTTGFRNTTLGRGSGVTITTGSNLTLIGFNAWPSGGSATNEITLGNSDITSLRCSATTITSLSDMRDKKNIIDLTLGLDFISKIKPRQFNWDKREWYEDNKSDGTKMQEAPTAGFIAQELDEVQTTENAQWLNLVLKNNPEKWEATAGNLFPIVVKAIQELKTENDGLKTENNELKDRLSKLEQTQNILALEIEKINSNNTNTKEVKLTEK